MFNIDRNLADARNNNSQQFKDRRDPLFSGLINNKDKNKNKND